MSSKLKKGSKVLKSSKDIVEVDFEGPEVKLQRQAVSELISFFSIGAGIRALQIVINHLLPEDQRGKAVDDYMNSWRPQAQSRLEDQRAVLQNTLQGIVTDEQLTEVFAAALEEAESQLRLALLEK